MRVKWLATVALGLLGASVAMTIVNARKTELASLPVSVCTLKFDGVTLENIPQATTEVQMQRGLQGLEDVGPGMLFTWSDDAPRVFWMRDTPTPLSIAFIDSKGVVLQVEDMEPETDIFHWSALPAREAFEMKIGEFQRLGIVQGSKIIDRECKPIEPQRKIGTMP